MGEGAEGHTVYDGRKDVFREVRREKEDKHAEKVGKSDQLNRAEGSRGDSPLQGQGTASLVGFGATPQLFLVRPTPKDKSTRRRQRSVPAPNFARPQTRPQLALSATRTLSRQMGATESQQGQQPPSAADPVFRFNHPMPASTASSHSVASSSSQSSSQPSSSQSSSSSVCPIPLNADGRAVPTNISSLSANIIR